MSSLSRLFNMLEKEDILLIVYFIVVILLLIAFVVVFFVVYQKRKNKILQEKYEAEKRFEQEIFRSKFEIQEQTLKMVGWELHDNIGQLLSVAKMQLNIFGGSLQEPEKNKIMEIGEVVGSSLQEVRSLSKSLNNEIVEYLGLEGSIKNELARFERINVLKPKLEITGNKIEIDQKDAIILYRILQEFCSNVIKHAKAKNLMVSLNYEPDMLYIEIAD
ncbi:MAG TPA: histidine kinase, partial [Salinimicrobium sp.]|nr:histidine kinase [Salinimicrobium sp.]